MKDQFIVPPFSVLDGRNRDWQRRNRFWRKRGIRSEEGREEGLTYGNSQGMNAYLFRDELQEKLGYQPSWEYVTELMQEKGLYVFHGTSVFNETLCEVLYTWFSKAGDSVLDPFCGGSVRGIMAGLLKRKYAGIDVRPEQIEANEANAGEVINVKAGETMPVYFTADSRNLYTLPIAEKQFDFLFSCPPYGNTEVYSDLSGDISTMPELEFYSAYNEIIYESLELLRENRFAVFVVGNYRREDGTVVNMFSRTIEAFENNGAFLYNDFIYQTPVGTLPVRAGRGFQKSRKMGRTHNHVLVFWKGDLSAVKNYGSVKLTDLQRNMMFNDAGKFDAYKDI